MFTVTSYIYIEAGERNKNDNNDSDRNDDYVCDSDVENDDDDNDRSNDDDNSSTDEGGSICFLRKTTPKVSRNKITIPSSPLLVGFLNRPTKHLNGVIYQQSEGLQVLINF